MEGHVSFGRPLKSIQMKFNPSPLSFSDCKDGPIVSLCIFLEQQLKRLPIRNNLSGMSTTLHCDLFFAIPSPRRITSLSSFPFFLFLSLPSPIPFPLSPFPFSISFPHFLSLPLCNSSLMYTNFTSRACERCVVPRYIT